MCGTQFRSRFFLQTISEVAQAAEALRLRNSAPLLIAGVIGCPPAMEQEALRCVLRTPLGSIHRTARVTW